MSIKFITNKVLVFTAALIALLALFGIAAYQASSARGAAAQIEPEVISQEQLEEEFGLQVYRVALTAVDGILDVRLKVTDAQKAKDFFQTVKDYPAVAVGSKGTLLKVPAEAQQDLQSLENGQMIFILPTNLKAMIKRDSMVTIVFGEVRLEPIRVQ